MEFDAVIVGAGHNSLACAAHLSAKGWRVAVFEQASEPGGAVKTRELTKSGFRHDWAAMNLSLFAGSPFFKAHGDDLTRLGLEFAPVTDCFATAFPDGRWLGVSTDIEATTARISKFSKTDAETWRTLVAAFPGRAEYLFGLLGSDMTKRALAALAFRIWRREGLGYGVELLRFLLSSPRAFLDQTFEAPEVRAMLGAWGMHLDFAPDVAGGALFPYLEGMANQSFGMVLGRGGADTIIDALVALVEEKGGQVECNAAVSNILRHDGRAVGVELADGRQVKAGKAVICNSAPSNLVDGLLDGSSGNESYDTAMRGFDHAPGTMMVHLALDGLPDWAAGDELKKFAYVHLAPSLDQMAMTYAEAKAGLLPREPILVVGQPTAVDPTRAPDGKHVLWVQVRMAPAEVKGDAAGEIEPADWDTMKEAFADRAMSILERYAPGTGKKVIARTVVSPVELESDNPNLVGGDQICGSHHLTQHFLYRPASGYANKTTPIDRLHLIGAAAWPGAGLGAGSGFMLASRLTG